MIRHTRQEWERIGIKRLREWQDEKVEEVGIIHHGDKCEWVRRRKEGRGTKD